MVVEETQLFKVTVSFGNVNSLISLPCYMSHASIPAAVRAARGLPDDLVSSVARPDGLPGSFLAASRLGPLLACLGLCVDFWFSFAGLG